MYCLRCYKKKSKWPLPSFCMCIVTDLLKQCYISCHFEQNVMLLKTAQRNGYANSNEARSRFELKKKIHINVWFLLQVHCLACENTEGNIKESLEGSTTVWVYILLTVLFFLLCLLDQDVCPIFNGNVCFRSYCKKHAPSSHGKQMTFS